MIHHRNPCPKKKDFYNELKKIISITCRYKYHEKSVKYKPAVTKTVLVFLAGIAWACVGVMLFILAMTWLLKAYNINIYLFAGAGAGAGVLMALIIHRFGFLKIVDKNLERILPMDIKKCMFSFITWKSYSVTYPIFFTSNGSTSGSHQRFLCV